MKDKYIKSANFYNNLDYYTTIRCFTNGKIQAYSTSIGNFVIDTHIQTTCQNYRSFSHARDNWFTIKLGVNRAAACWETWDRSRQSCNRNTIRHDQATNHRHQGYNGTIFWVEHFKLINPPCMIAVCSAARMQRCRDFNNSTVYNTLK